MKLRKRKKDYKLPGDYMDEMIKEKNIEKKARAEVYEDIKALFKCFDARICYKVADSISETMYAQDAEWLIQQLEKARE